MTLLIDNCTRDDFDFVCPKAWSALRPTYSEGVRHCDQCSRKVYLCRTDADLKLYDSLGYCVAISEAAFTARRSPPAAEARQKEDPPPDETRIRFIGVYRRRHPA